MNCSWAVIAGDQHKEAEKHIVYIITYLVSWKILISGSFIFARFYSINLAHCRWGTEKKADVPRKKRTNLSKRAMWALVLITTARNYGRKAK